jgi:predicted MFS family arabinose efflux permease
LKPNAVNDVAKTTGPWALALGGLLALAAAMGIGRFVYTPILPMMVASEGLSAAQAGMIASGNFLGYLVGALLATTPLMQGSPRAWLLGSLLASGLTTLLMAWTDSYTGFVAVRFAGGVVSAWVLVFASSLVISRLIEQGRGELGAVLFAGVGVGIALAALLTGMAEAVNAGWRGAWIVNGVAALLATVLVTWLVPGRAGIMAQKTETTSPGDQGIHSLLLAYGLFGFGYIITATFIVQLVRVAAYSTAMEMVIWLLVGLTAVPSVWLWNRFAKCHGNNRALSVACLLLAFGVAASVLLPGLWGLVTGALLLGATFMGITALGLAAVRARVAGDPRKPLALMTAAFGLGQIIGPVVGGVMRDALGSFLLPSLLASVALVVSALLVHASTRPR